MDKRRSGRRVVAGVALALLAGAPLQAQETAEDYRTIVTIMRACATIAEVPARVACYDNTLANTHASRAAAAAPVSPAPPASRPVTPPPATGFGAETLPQARAAQAAQQEEAAELVVTAIRELQPGVAVLTLADGGQWRFVDAAGFGYDMPRRGQSVRLERGALGSFYLHFNGQRALRVQRVQ